jgi:hypothetical protein
VIPEPELIAWRKTQINRLSKQVGILRGKIEKNKAWSGAEQELEALRAQLRSHLVCLDLEEHNE